MFLGIPGHILMNINILHKVIYWKISLIQYYKHIWILKKLHSITYYWIKKKIQWMKKIFIFLYFFLFFCSIRKNEKFKNCMKLHVVTTKNVNRLIIINITVVAVSYKNEISKPKFVGMYYMDVAESKNTKTSSEMLFLHPAPQLYLVSRYSSGKYRVSYIAILF